MHRTAFTIAAITVSAAGSIASADIVRVSEFDSAEMEGFQGLSMSTFETGEVQVFGGMGTLFSTDDSWVHTTGAWTFRQRVSAYEGDRLMGTSSGGVGYRFDVAQKSFGGYFASISDVPDGQINFYSGEVLVGTDALMAPTDTSWKWNGWSSDESFDRVEISSNFRNAGFILHDAVRLLSTKVPAPSSSMLLMGGMLVLARRRR